MNDIIGILCLLQRAFKGFYKLFATLDPTTRVLELKDGQQILLTDTVGFIRKLPHHLVVGSGVANNLSSARIPAPVNVFKSVDFPALV